MIPPPQTIANYAMDGFLSAIVEGLSRPVCKKFIPSQFLYDERGCELFDKICELPEYYPTRTELTILEEHADEISVVCGSGCKVIELGSGSGTKTRLLLDHLDEPEMYVPVDIAPNYLRTSADDLNQRYPDLPISPVCANFTLPFEVPVARELRTVIFFPGSTIGNFHWQRSVKLLRKMRLHCVPDGGVLIGVDLKKDIKLLESAYNDSQGITAAFNLNLLARMQRELDADLDLEAFAHEARYNELAGRVEISLRSCRDQVIRIVGGHEFRLTENELISSEYSYKYDLADVQNLAKNAGFWLTHAWLDAKKWFGIFFFAVRPEKK